MASHYLKDRDLYELLKGVYENGYFQLVSFDYETPLWFYCNNLNDSKIHVSYEIMERLEDENTVIINLRIYNNGKAYLNHNWETVSLVNLENGNKAELEKNIAPGQTVDMMISYEKGSYPLFRLENEYGLICRESEFNPEAENE